LELVNGAKRQERGGGEKVQVTDLGMKVRKHSGKVEKERLMEEKIEAGLLKKSRGIEGKY
jgi:hypothetical protein